MILLPQRDRMWTMIQSFDYPTTPNGADFHFKHALSLYHSLTDPGLFCSPQMCENWPMQVKVSQMQAPY